VAILLPLILPLGDADLEQKNLEMQVKKNKNEPQIPTFLRIIFKEYYTKLNEACQRSKLDQWAAILQLCTTLCSKILLPEGESTTVSHHTSILRTLALGLVCMKNCPFRLYYIFYIYLKISGKIPTVGDTNIQIPKHTIESCLL
jgi:hypothetical protein